MGEQFHSGPDNHGGDVFVPYHPSSQVHRHDVHVRERRDRSRQFSGPSDAGSPLPFWILVIAGFVAVLCIILVVIAQILYALTSSLWTIVNDNSGLLWGAVAAICLVLLALVVAMLWTNRFAE